MREVIIGALVAALISLGTSIMTLLSQSGVHDLSDISQVAWLMAFMGAGVSFLKDFQAINFRNTTAAIGGRTYTPPQPPEKSSEGTSE